VAEDDKGVPIVVTVGTKAAAEAAKYEPGRALAPKGQPNAVLTEITEIEERSQGVMTLNVKSLCTLSSLASVNSVRTSSLFGDLYVTKCIALPERYTALQSCRASAIADVHDELE
jgi:hypothetical protein